MSTEEFNKTHVPEDIERLKMQPTDILLDPMDPFVLNFNKMFFAFKQPEVQDFKIKEIEYLSEHPELVDFRLPEDQKAYDDLKLSIIKAKKDARALAKDYRKLRAKMLNSETPFYKQSRIMFKLPQLEEQIKKLREHFELNPDALYPLHHVSAYDPNYPNKLEEYEQIFIEGEGGRTERVLDVTEIMKDRTLYIVAYKIRGEVQYIPLTYNSLTGRSGTVGKRLDEILKVTSEKQERKFAEDKEMIQKSLERLDQGVIGEELSPLEEQTSIIEQEVVTSDAKGAYYVEMTESILFDRGEIVGVWMRPIINMRTGRPYPDSTGSLFKYLNKSEYNLERYQIISDSSRLPICSQHCLFYALQFTRINKEQINLLKNIIHTEEFPKTKLKVVSEVLDLNIKLYYIQMDRKSHNVYGNKEDKVSRERVANYPKQFKEGKPIIELALFKNHYFVYDTNIEGYRSSLSLIKSLYEEGLFERSDIFRATSILYDENMLEAEVSTLHQIPMKTTSKKTPEPLIDTSIFFADTEATVNNKVSIANDVYKPTMWNKTIRTEIDCYLGHIACLHAFTCRKGTKSIICPTLNDLFYFIKVQSIEEGSKKALVYYHNLKYDFSLMKKDPAISLKKIVTKDNMLYSVDLSYGFFTIELRDSCKMINQPLATFARAFNLPHSKKEFIIYTLYTEDNLRHGGCVTVQTLTEELLDNIYEAYRIVRDKFSKFSIETLMMSELSNYVVLDKRIAIERSAIDTINKSMDKVVITPPTLVKMRTKTLEKMGAYKHKEHYEFYLNYDCLVLRDGMENFTGELRTLLNIEPYKYLTISSLAHDYVMRNGAYDGVFSIFGTSQDFITKSRYGGRVASRFNDKHVCFKKSIAFDGVSLYPSAMVRLCNEIGLPACQFEIIQDTDHFNSLRSSPNTIYFVVEIKVYHDLKEQQIPFARIITEQRTLVSTHQVKDKVLHIGKIQFEDLVNFCGLCSHNKKDEDCDGSCYEFISGIFWYDRDGHSRNKNLGPLVQTLFDIRKQSKGAKNTSIKLLLNSIYGKNMQLVSKYNTKCIDEKRRPNYVTKNCDRIISCKKIGKSTVTKEMVTSFYDANNIHIACMILEMSKRIMHEIMNIADEENITILYTDTDSMHIIDEDGSIDRLASVFRERYHRELIGDDLGQFHNDFKLNGCTNVYAIKEYIIGKKVYYSRIEGIDDKTGEIKHDDVIKFKGVNAFAVREQVQKTYGTVENLYKALINGESITFDLTAGDAVIFNLTGDCPSTKDILTRVQCFSGKRIHYYGCSSNDLEFTKL